MAQEAPSTTSPEDESGSAGAADADQHLRTDTVRADLKRRSVRSGLIMFASQPVMTVLGASTTIILARLLTPADFGLVAMVTPILPIVESLRNFGLQAATVQREEVSHHQASALFWLALKINAVVIGLMALMAPVLAWFYGREQLVAITLVMAGGMLIISLAAQHESLIKRQMRFGSLAVIQAAALFIGLVAAVTAAWFGAGYWALVIHVVVMQLVRAAAFWLVCGWRPSWKGWNTLNIDDTVRSMLSYGAHLTGFRFITRVGLNLDRVLIGYFSGATALGFYDVAYKWAQAPYKKIHAPLSDVAVSSFSRVQQQPERYRAYARRGLMPIFALCLPALAFCCVEARNVILLLLGNQWLEAVPLFRLLTAAMFVESMFRVTKWLYLSEDQTQRQLRWGFVRTPVTIVFVAVGAQWGAFGVAAGLLAATSVLTFPGIAYCLKTSPITWSDFAAAVWRPAVASIVAAGALYLSSPYLPNFDVRVLDIALRLLFFGLVYLALWVVLPGGRRTLADLLSMLQAIRAGRKQPLENT